jgi:hypothetical protein
MRITAQDLRRLLDSDAQQPDLVLHEGTVEVVAAAELQSERYAGVLQVVSRDALVEQLGGTDVSDLALKEMAARLDTEVSNLGG